jgi:gamma-glutamylcysteine synthetase
LAARAGRISLRELCRELLAIAVTGLERARQLNKRGDDESIYLLRLLDLVRQGSTCGSLVIERWKGAWNYDVARLVRGSSYDSEALL